MFSRSGATAFGLGALTAAGLAVDAYVHFDLASNYDAIKTSTLSQGDLFRAEAVVAILAAIAVAVRPNRYSAGAAFAVAASGLAALLVYRYNNIAAFGPVPAMYEPVWFTEKSVTAIAEAISTITAAVLLATVELTTRKRKLAV